MARRRFLIDCVPDDALPRLQPRPLPYAIDKLVLLLVSLRDCAPFMETWPPDLDELAVVATRLLLVPGGPLVLEDGVLTGGFPLGVSNHILEPLARVAVGKGVLAVGWELAPLSGK